MTTTTTPTTPPRTPTTPPGTPTGTAAPLPPPPPPPPPSAGAPESRGARAVWLTLGSLLAVAGLLWGTFQVIGLLAHGEYRDEFSFPADDVRSLDIRSDHGSTTVIAQDVDTVTVTADVSDGLRPTDVDARIVSGVLELRGGCPRIPTPWCDVDFTVTVPADRPIRVDASDGRVLVREISAPIDVDNDNGTIELDGVSGSVRATNDNGRIEGRRLTSESVTTTSSNGSIDLEFSEPPTVVSGDSRNGSIEVVVPDDEVLYRVELRARNGGTDNAVRTDPASDRLIDLTTQNGSVTVRPSS